MTSAPDPAKRPRDAAATRHSIFASAVELFTAHGYDGIGVREIAAAAGVSAMLVNRYFGSKEGLFEEVVERTLAPESVTADSARTVARDAARHLVARTGPGSSVANPYLLVLRSASSPRAVEIIGSALQRQSGGFFPPVAGGAEDAERVMLANALIAGVWLMRSVLAVEPLVAAEPAALERQIEAMLGALFQSSPE